jgi:hypothetical protein
VRSTSLHAVLAARVSGTYRDEVDARCPAADLKWPNSGTPGQLSSSARGGRAVHRVTRVAGERYTSHSVAREVSRSSSQGGCELVMLFSARFRSDGASAGDRARSPSTNHHVLWLRRQAGRAPPAPGQARRPTTLSQQHLMPGPQRSHDPANHHGTHTPSSSDAFWPLPLPTLGLPKGLSPPEK